MKRLKFILKRGILAGVMIALSGCLQSNDPVIDPGQADHPFKKYSHFVQYDFDEISNEWRPSGEAAIRLQDDGTYEFLLRTKDDQKQGDFIIKDTNLNVNGGEIYAAQTSYIATYIYFAVVISGGDQKTLSLYSFDCPDNRCNITDWRSLVGIFKTQSYDPSGTYKYVEDR